MARVHGFCSVTAVIGSEFYVMDYVPGRVFFDPRLPGLPKHSRGAIFQSMNKTIAAIHNLDPAEIGLSDFGRRGNFMARQITRWSKQYRASETENIPAMDKLIAWLPGTYIPPESKARIVHGDNIDWTKSDRVPVDEPQVSAVLDWELSTLGEPVADFAYQHVSTWHIRS